MDGYQTYRQSFTYMLRASWACTAYVLGVYLELLFAGRILVCAAWR
eukprot:COSAG05_NODE_17753_length_319_cov_5.377273_1_plen_45_part_10